MDIKKFFSETKSRKHKTNYNLGSWQGLDFQIPGDFDVKRIETVSICDNHSAVVGNCSHPETNKLFITDAGRIDNIILEIDGECRQFETNALGDNDVFFVPKGMVYAIEVTEGSGLIILSDTLLDDEVKKKVMC